MHSGSVSLADAIARARGIAAEKGVSYDSGRGNGSEFGDPKSLDRDQSVFNRITLTILAQHRVGTAIQGWPVAHIAAPVHGQGRLPELLAIVFGTITIRIAMNAGMILDGPPPQGFREKDPFLLP